MTPFLLMQKRGVGTRAPWPLAQHSKKGKRQAQASHWSAESWADPWGRARWILASHGGGQRHSAEDKASEPLNKKEKSVNCELAAWALGLCMACRLSAVSNLSMPLDAMQRCSLQVGCLLFATLSFMLAE